jgi:Tfp pilus assembly protein PilX
MTKPTIDTIGTLQNERGSILLIALILMVVMGIFGSILTSTSTTEQKLSGNYRSSQESFYAADRAVEYAIQETSSSDTEIDLYNDAYDSTTSHRDNLEIDNSSGIEDPDDSTETDANQVVYISTGAPTSGSRMDATLFQGRNYRVTTVGVFPLSSENPSRTVVRAYFQKIVSASSSDL